MERRLNQRPRLTNLHELPRFIDETGENEPAESGKALNIKNLPTPECVALLYVKEFAPDSTNIARVLELEPDQISQQLAEAEKELAEYSKMDEEVEALSDGGFSPVQILAELGKNHKILLEKLIRYHTQPAVGERLINHFIHGYSVIEAIRMDKVRTNVHHAINKWDSICGDLLRNIRFNHRPANKFKSQNYSYLENLVLDRPKFFMKCVMRLDETDRNIILDSHLRGITETQIAFNRNISLDRLRNRVMESRRQIMEWAQPNLSTDQAA